MGDRVLFQVHGEQGISPVVYGHWSADKAPEICAALQARMKGREGDVQYTAARLVQEVCASSSEGKGNLSVGMWNAEKLLTSADSHGDGGVVLIQCTPHGLKFKCLGGYLKATKDGAGVSLNYAGGES